MNIITLKCCCIFGKGDSTDWEQDFDLTEEEITRLKAAAKTGTSFMNADSVSDIYERLYDIIVSEATEQLLEDDEDIQEEYGEEDDFRADELYEYRIDYPESF